MISRKLISVRLWPLYLLLTMLCLVAVDVGRGLAIAPFPPALLGAIPLLLCGVFRGLIKPPRQNNMMLHVVIFTALLAGMSLFATAAIPGASPTHLLGISLGLGIAISMGAFRLSNASSVVDTSFTDSTKSISETQDLGISQQSAPLLKDEFETLPGGEYEDEEQQGEVLQSWSRIKLPSGIERLEGSLTVEFQAGEKIQHCHLPISPPLKKVPSAWCECSDGGIRAEFSLLQTYGARLTLRRSVTSFNEESTEVTFILESPSESLKAA